VDKIIVDKSTILEMPNKLKSECFDKDRKEPCFPNTTLTLIKKGKKYSFPSYISSWEGSFFIHFVKIDKNSYAVDLDGDGQKEVAIYPEVTDKAPYSKAYLYTVKGNKLLPYGTGDHYWESGLSIVNIKKDPHFKPDL